MIALPRHTTAPGTILLQARSSPDLGQQHNKILWHKIRLAALLLRAAICLRGQTSGDGRSDSPNLICLTTHFASQTIQPDQPRYVPPYVEQRIK